MGVGVKPWKAPTGLVAGNGVKLKFPSYFSWLKDCFFSRLELDLGYSEGWQTTSTSPVSYLKSFDQVLSCKVQTLSWRPHCGAPLTPGHGLAK